MPEPNFKDTNKLQKIMAIDSPQTSSLGLSPENHALDQIMSKIQRDGNLEEVITAIQKVERKFPKYQNAIYYKLWLPGPSLLIKEIKNIFEQNLVTKPLFKKLDWDKTEINICNILYSITIVVSVLSLICILLAFTGFYWGLLILPLLVICIFSQMRFFEHAIKYIAFVKIYETMCNVLEHRYREHSQYVQNVISFPEQVQLRFQQTEKNKIFATLNSEEQEHLERLELEKAQSLQDLAACVAIAQKSTEAEIKTIENKTKLDYLQQDLHIRDGADLQKRRHEMAMAAINCTERYLVEQAKILGKDENERRKIDYQLKLLNGIKGDFQSNGNQSFASESVYESINKMMEMMTNPESTRE